MATLNDEDGRESQEHFKEWIQALFSAETWAERKNIVELRNDELLTNATDHFLTNLIDEFKNKNEPQADAAKLVEEYRELLSRCRRDGIEAAFSEYLRKEKLQSLVKEINNSKNQYTVQQLVTRYQTALLVADRDLEPELWAAFHGNLARSLIKPPLDEQTEHLEQAIFHAEQSLTVYTRENFLKDWVIAQQTLAKTYSKRMQWAQAENFERATYHYQLVLEVLTPATFPEECMKAAYDFGCLLYDVNEFTQARLVLTIAHKAIEFALGKGRARKRLAITEEIVDLYNRLVFCCLQENDQKSAHKYASIISIERVSLDQLAATVLRQKHIEYLSEQVNQLCQQSQYEKALPLALQLFQLSSEHAAGKRIDTWQQTLEDVACSLRDVASLCKTNGHYVQAKQLYEWALAIQLSTQGRDDPDIIPNLIDLGTLAQETKDYAQAEMLFQWAANIQRDTYGEDNPDLAYCLSLLGLLCNVQGQYKQALIYYQQVVDIRQKMLGETHPDYLLSLNDLAATYQNIANYDQAELLYRQVLNIIHTTYGEDHPEVAVSLNNLGSLYIYRGKYAQAEPLLQQALAIWQVEEDPRRAGALHNLAGLYELLGNYAKAEPLLQQAITLQRANMGEDHPDVASGLNNLGLLYQRMGRYAQAEQLYTQAYEIRSRVLPPDHPSLAESLNNLGSIAEAMGDISARIKPFFQKALSIERKALGDMHPYVAHILNDLAVIYMKAGDYTQVEPLLQEALTIRRTVLGEQHPSVAQTLDQLVNLYTLTDQYTKAEALFSQILAIQRNSLGEHHPNVARSLDDFALFYQSQGNYVQAELLFQQALDILRATLGEGHPEMIDPLINLGRLYAATERYTEALELLERATFIEDQIIRQVFSIGSEAQLTMLMRTLRVTTMIFLALVSQYLAHSQLSVQKALNLVLRRKALTSDATASQHKAILRRGNGALKPTLDELSTVRGQIVQKLLTGQGPEGLESYQRQVDMLTIRMARLEKDLAFQLPEIDLGQQLRDVNTQSIARILPAKGIFVEFFVCSRINFKAVPARKETLVEENHYLAFVLSADNPNAVTLVDLGKVDLIDKKIAAFRKFITSKTENMNTLPEDMPLQTSQNPLVQQDVKRVKTQEIHSETRHVSPYDENTESTFDPYGGKALREMLFDPLLKAFGGGSRLFLSPDGNLSVLPFEVLPTDNGHRLIDAYHISYLSAGRDILRFDESSSGHPGIPMVIADPDFDLSNTNLSVSVPREAQDSHLHDQSRTSGPFKRLSGTRTEGEQIAALLGVQPFLAEHALEGKIKKAHSPHILHLATHGYFLPDQKRDRDKEFLVVELLAPQEGKLAQLSRTHAHSSLSSSLSSGLALAGANTSNWGGALPSEAEDGLLTAVDVMELDLLRTELVVLSACDTGLGDVVVGEGVFGLRRAFVQAGAKTLVMSLWQVPDQQTQELMELFYRRILAGYGRSEALWEAQLSMKAKYHETFYWGAFICQGYPGPLGLIRE